MTTKKKIIIFGSIIVGLVIIGFVFANNLPKTDGKPCVQVAVGTQGDFVGTWKSGVCTPVDVTV